MSLTGVINSHLMMAYSVWQHGSEEQKSRFLPRMCSGELRGGLALTEADVAARFGPRAARPYPCAARSTSSFSALMAAPIGVWFGRSRKWFHVDLRQFYLS